MYRTHDVFEHKWEYQIDSNGMQQILLTTIRGSWGKITTMNMMTGLQISSRNVQIKNSHIGAPPAMSSSKTLTMVHHLHLQRPTEFNEHWRREGPRTFAFRKISTCMARPSAQRKTLKPNCSVIHQSKIYLHNPKVGLTFLFTKTSTSGRLCVWTGFCVVARWRFVLRRTILIRQLVNQGAEYIWGHFL